MEYSIWERAISNKHVLWELSTVRSSYIRIYYEIDKRCEVIWLKQFLELCGFIVIDKLYSLDNMKNHSKLDVDNYELEPINIILLSKNTNKTLYDIIDDIHKANFTEKTEFMIGSSKIFKEYKKNYTKIDNILHYYYLDKAFFYYDLNYEDGKSLNDYARDLMIRSCPNYQKLVDAYIKDDNQLAKSFFLIKNVFYNRKVDYSSFSSKVELLRKSASYLKNVINNFNLEEQKNLFEELYFLTYLMNTINNAVSKDLRLDKDFWYLGNLLFNNANYIYAHFYRNKCDTITKNTNWDNNAVIINKLIIEILSNTALGWIDLRDGVKNIQKITDSTIDNCLEEFKPQILAPTIDFLYCNNRFNESIPLAEKIIEYAPENYLSLFRLGFLYYKNGDTKKANEFYGRATNCIKEIDSKYLTPMEIIYYYNSIYRKIKLASYKVEASSNSSMVDELYSLTCKLKEEILSFNGNYQNEFIQQMFASSNSNLSFITFQDINTIISEIIEQNIINNLNIIETKVNNLKIKKK